MNVYKHTKRWLTLFVIRKIKVIMNFYYIPTGITISTKLTIENVDKHGEKLELWYNDSENIN